MICEVKWKKKQQDEESVSIDMYRHPYFSLVFPLT